MINELRKILTDRITVKQEEKIKLVSKCPQVPQTDPQERKTCFCSAGEGEIPLNAGAGLYEIKCSLPTC